MILKTIKTFPPIDAAADVVGIVFMVVFVFATIFGGILFTVVFIVCIFFNLNTKNNGHMLRLKYL